MKIKTMKHDSESMFKKYAESIGVEIKELTVEQKQIAILNHFLSLDPKEIFEKGVITRHEIR